MSRTPVPQTYENGLPWDRLGDVARPSPGLRMKVDSVCRKHPPQLSLSR